MVKIFDGKELAVKIEAEVKEKIQKLGRKPVLVTIYNTNDQPSRIYSNIKAAKARELGVEFRQYGLLNTTDVEGLVININRKPEVDGFMIQLPLTGDKSEDIKLCSLIDPKKDADGLNPRSGMMQATVRAVMEILSLGERSQRREVVVVGNHGAVGSGLVSELSKNNDYEVIGMGRYDFDADKLRQAVIIISATGQEGLIKPDFVKDGAICIDVGYPKGDFDPKCAEKAAFFTPVPGGVGPVTVACLFKNLAELIEKNG
jgi:methylenetetrahydrofolate dehydrogenase (NADP+) / methenyltetrahydrofolate cyclohydrolase